VVRTRWLGGLVWLLAAGVATCDQPGPYPDDAGERESSPTAAANPGFDDTTPRFSPDGAVLVFVRERSDDSDLFIMDMVDRESRLLADVSEYDLDPAFAPDGERLVFETSPNQYAQLHLVSLDGSGVEAISEVLDGWATFPAWSPRGDRIVYSCGRPIYETSDLCVLTPDGRFLGALEDPSESQELQPTWSPDGSTIAFSSDRSGSRDLYLIRLASGSVTRLTSGPEVDGDPTFSPDGSTIAFTRGTADADVCLLALNSGDVDCITEGIQPSWSPNGEMIAFYRNTDRGSRIFGARADGTDVEQLT
jgi:TolB protein